MQMRRRKQVTVAEWAHTLFCCGFPGDCPGLVLTGRATNPQTHHTMSLRWEAVGPGASLPWEAVGLERACRGFIVLTWARSSSWVIPSRLSSCRG